MGIPTLTMSRAFLCVVALLGAVSAFTPKELNVKTPLAAYGALPNANVMPVAGAAITNIGAWQSTASKAAINPPANLALGWPFGGKGGVDNLPLPYTLKYDHTLHGYAGLPLSAGPASHAFAKKDLEKPGMQAKDTDKLPAQTKASVPAFSGAFVPAATPPASAPYGLPKVAPFTPSVQATSAQPTTMPKLSAVPAPLTSLPTAAPMALPNTGYGFPHGAMFGIQNGKVPKGGYTNVAEPKNVNPYNPGTQYDAYANAMASYKYYQNSPYTGLRPSQVPITHVKTKAFGVVPAPLFPGKVWAKGTADGKVAYFNSDPAGTEAVHSWPAYGKHSQAQTNQILQTRYLAENQKVGTLAVNGLAHAVSANIAQNQEHNKMQAKALEQILKETEEQKAAVAEALAQVEKTIKPASEAVAEDSDNAEETEKKANVEENAKADDKAEETASVAEEKKAIKSKQNAEEKTEEQSSEEQSSEEKSSEKQSSEEQSSEEQSSEQQSSEQKSSEQKSSEEQSSEEQSSEEQSSDEKSSEEKSSAEQSSEEKSSAEQSSEEQSSVKKDDGKAVEKAEEQKADKAVEKKNDKAEEKKGAKAVEKKDGKAEEKKGGGYSTK